VRAGLFLIMSNRFKPGDRVVHRSLPTRHASSTTLGKTRITKGTIQEIKIKKNKRGTSVTYCVIKKDSNGLCEEYMSQKLELIKE